MSTNPLHSNDQLFSRQLDAMEYIQLQNLLQLISFKPGEVFAVGNTHLYRLHTGKLNKFYKTLETTDERGNKPIKLKEWFNYSAFFMAETGRERFRCVTACECWRLDRQAFIEALKQNPNLAAALVHHTNTVQILAAANALQADSGVVGDLRSEFFKSISDAEFLTVAKIIRAGKANRGEMLIEQGGNHTRLYFLRNGRLRIRQVDTKGVEQRQGDIQAGKRVNATAFIIETINKHTLEVFDPTQYWYIERDDFQKLIKTQPNIGSQVKSTPEAEEYRAKKAKFPWLKNGELVQMEVYRHPWFFWRRVLPTVLIFFVALLVWIVLFFEALGGQTFAILSLITVVPWWLWNYADWKNDYLVITDQRVLQRERVIGLFDRRDELQIDRVDNIEVRVPDWIQKNVLGTGSIKIEAAGVGSYVAFDLVRDPDGIKNKIYSTRDFVRARKRAFQLKHLREHLTKAVEGFTTSDAKADSSQPTQTPWAKWLAGQKTRMRASLDGWFGVRKLTTSKHWSSVINSWWPTDHYLDGKNTVYRRAMLVLFTEIFAPFVAIIAYLGVFGLFFYGEIRGGWQTPIFTYCLPFGFFGVILAIWFLYKYEDWRNDTYVLKPDVIVDNYRTPFAIRGTRTQQTGYERITNSESRTKGVLGWLDIGDVVLKTGAEGEIVLKGVYSPRRVLQDILKRRDQLDEEKQAKIGVERQREIGEALRIYDEYVRSHRRGTLYSGDITKDGEF